MTEKKTKINEKIIDVIGIGNAIVDVLIYTNDSFLENNALKKGSMTLINESEAEKLYFTSKSSLETSGGSAANTIAGISSLGSAANFIGRIKEDHLGNIFKSDICKTGVSFDTIPIKEGPPTARCFIYITPDAERTMCTFLGSSVFLEPKDIDFSILKNAKILYLEGYLWDLNSAKDSFITAAKECKAYDGKVALSLSDSFCINRHRESFKELINQYVDIVFANEDEIKTLLQTESLDSAVEIIKEICDISIITKGAKGSIIVEKKNKHIIQPYNFGNVIDTTGAGDLYASGFLHGFVKGKDLKVCGLMGSICSGYIVTQLGSRANICLKKLIHENLV